MYGVALVSRIDKIMGLCCKRALQKRQYSAKETYHFIDLTDRSHPICHMTPPYRPTLSIMPKYLRASPTEASFGSWYSTGTKEFRPTNYFG